MTRINVVPVECLTDKHLLAEYKEITRPFNKVIKRIEKGTMSKVTIPNNYCLGKGHETFFFNKLRWLHDRYLDIYKELKYSRGFNINDTVFTNIYNDLENKLSDTGYWNNYEPTPEDMYLNMARLAKRSNLNNVLEELNENN